MIRFIFGTILTFFAMGEMLCSLVPPISKFVPIFFFHCSCGCNKSLFFCFFEPSILLLIGLLLLMDRIRVCFREGIFGAGYILLSFGLLALGIAGNSYFVHHIGNASMIPAAVGVAFLVSGAVMVFTYLKRITAF